MSGGIDIEFGIAHGKTNGKGGENEQKRNHGSVVSCRCSGGITGEVKNDGLVVAMRLKTKR